MAEKPSEEGYISVVDEEPEILELLKWDGSHSQNMQKPTEQIQQEQCEQKLKTPERNVPKDAKDPFEMPDPAFVETYRLTKELVHNLCQELAPLMTDCTRSLEYSVETKLLATLAFFATGKYQKMIAGKTDPNMTQYIVTNAVSQITQALNHPTIVKKYIHFPHLSDERVVLKARFYLKCCMPNTVGCIDCMHVPIMQPAFNQKPHFNKSYHSKKVQIICDSDLNVISVDATSGGSLTHDTILNSHAVKNDLLSLNQSGEQCWLVGSNFYSLKPYIMVPIPKVTKKQSMTPEKHYQSLHSQTITCVTETIKQIKSRWKVLQACNKQFEPEDVSDIVVACCILHNICNKHSLPVVPMTQTEERLELMKQRVANPPVTKKPTEDPAGVEVRMKLVERLWNERRVPPEVPKKRISKKERILQAHYEQPTHSVPIIQQQPTMSAPPSVSMPQMPQVIPNHNIQVQMLHPQMHQQLMHEDPAKRPRLVMNNPPAVYQLGVASGWGHFPPH